VGGADGAGRVGVATLADGLGEANSPLPSAVVNGESEADEHPASNTTQAVKTTVERRNRKPTQKPPPIVNGSLYAIAEAS
jgi:hypothetical protein